jgi:hypothetical protein
VKIFSETQEYRVHMAKDLLESKGLDALIVDKQDRNYHFGEIELHVRDTDVIKAKHILQSFLE